MTYRTLHPNARRYQPPTLTPAERAFLARLADRYEYRRWRADLSNAIVCLGLAPELSHIDEAEWLAEHRGAVRPVDALLNKLRVDG